MFWVYKHRDSTKIKARCKYPKGWLEGLDSIVCLDNNNNYIIDCERLSFHYKVLKLC